jgi:hypothetical protein
VPGLTTSIEEGSAKTYLLPFARPGNGYLQPKIYRQIGCRMTGRFGAHASKVFSMVYLPKSGRRRKCDFVGAKADNNGNQKRTGATYYGMISSANCDLDTIKLENT